MPCKKCCCVFAHIYTLGDNLECSMDYELSLFPKVFSCGEYAGCDSGCGVITIALGMKI